MIEYADEKELGEEVDENENNEELGKEGIEENRIVEG